MSFNRYIYNNNIPHEQLGCVHKTSILSRRLSSLFRDADYLYKIIL